MEAETKIETSAPAAPVPADSPVTTVTPTDAITTNNDNVIVATVNGKYKRFASINHVPAGSRTYTSKAELKGQTKKQLETIYGYVKGCDPKSFKDHDTAVDNVWHAFQQLAVFDPVTEAPEERKQKPTKADATPDDKSKKSYQKKREENKYVIKASTEKSAKMIGELAPQAQACVEIIRKDGKPEYTEAELRDLMEKNKDKLRTRQTAWRIFQYYRSDLIKVDVLVQQ